jgi:hypothetical protein
MTLSRVRVKAKVKEREKAKERVKAKVKASAPMTKIADRRQPIIASGGASSRPAWLLAQSCLEQAP